MSKRGWILFGALGIIWGTPYMFIRIAVEYLSPAVVVCGRMTLGALLLLPFAIKEDLPAIWRSHKKGILLFAVVEMVLPFGALATAEKNISSSLAGLLIAAVPIVTGLLLRYTNHDDQWDKRRAVGYFIGLFGVAALVGLDITADNWWSIAITFIAVTGYALGPIVISTMLSDISDMGSITLAQVSAAAIYLPLLIWNIATGTWQTETAKSEGIPISAWLSVAALGILCTAIAFALLFQLIKEVGPSRTTVITYINPAVAILLGIALLGEPFTAGIAVGFPLVLLGSVLATRQSVSKTSAS